MKTLKKILPLTAITAVGAVPVVATSCSKVWVDMLVRPQTPSIQRYETKDGTNEVTSAEIAKIYTDYFINHQNEMMADFYWGASLWGRKTYPKGVTKLLTFLEYIDSVSLKIGSRGSVNNVPILTYHTRTQLEFRKEGLSGSYSIETYDLDYELNNLEFWPSHYSEVKDDDGETYQCWTLNPLKFNSNENTWWIELTDNEQIKFDFKAVKKGYGKNGAQNYINETAEAAIVDQEHKYAPALNEVYTNAMLHDSYYLSKLKPRLDVNLYTNYGTRPSSEDPFKTESNPFIMTIGEKTREKYKDCSIRVSVLSQPQVYSPLGSKLKIDNVVLKETEHPIKDGTFNIDLDLVADKTSGIAYVGDIAYYSLKLECIDANQKVLWKDYLYQSTYLIDHW